MYTPEVGYNKIFVTSPKLIFGQNYTVVVGESITQFFHSSEGHSGSVESPSINSPSERKTSTFEEFVVLDKEYDSGDKVEVDELEEDEVIFMDYHESDQDHSIKEGLLQEIEKEIDDYFNHLN